MGIFGIISLITVIIGSLALFLFGMKFMSEALQKLSGNKLRTILASFTSNRFKAAFTGTIVTTIIQSSSATTVMVVSFVNAGVLNLRNAIGVIMGSNIGTTITAWIITLFGIKYDISSLSIPIIGLGFIFMLIKNKRLKPMGECFMGFGLLFLGLSFLKDSVATLDLANNSAFIQFMTSFVSDSSISYATILLCVLIGAIITIILQSSSAMMAITLILCSAGAIPFEMALALVMGENIGTTFTANIAAAIGNIQAKKAARSHLIFNIIGVIWVLIAFRLIVPFVDKFTLLIEGHSPFLEASAIPFALSFFHSFFNLTNTALLIWFVPKIEKLSEYMVKRKPIDEDEIFKLEYISSGFVGLGELAIDSAKKEIQVYARRVTRMYEFIPQLMDLKDAKKYATLLERIEHYESISDKMEIEIANYLTSLSSDSITSETTLRVRGMLRIIDNLESIADQNFQLAKMIDDKNEQKIWFTPEMRENLNKLYELVRNALQIMNENLNDNYRNVEINRALEAEEQINNYRNMLRTEHLENLKNRVYPYETGIIYSGIYALLEKIGDFIINITEAIINAKYTKDTSITRLSQDPEDDD
ncbi:MAG: Na/Pi cotransporter family protein [Bacteroidales bacterium]|nr:Na/Pi cotransporter family protein [Bacteroidales bacterium]MDD4209666.1 Na/Pi cotransporter family protein [Bacteroidales bacterium]